MSAVVAVIAGAALIAVSWPLEGLKAGMATFIYTGAVVGMFTTSAVYHRVTWTSVRARTWMKRLDHSMIFVLIAGTYTPFALLAMPHDAGVLVLWIVWGGALAGVLLKMCWPTAPRWVGVPLYLILGWVSAFYIAIILHNAGVAPTRATADRTGEAATSEKSASYPSACRDIPQVGSTSPSVIRAAQSAAANASANSGPTSTNSPARAFTRERSESSRKRLHAASIAATSARTASVAASTASGSGSAVSTTASPPSAENSARPTVAAAVRAPMALRTRRT